MLENIYKGLKRKAQISYQALFSEIYEWDMTVFCTTVSVPISLCHESLLKSRSFENEC